MEEKNLFCFSCYAGGECDTTGDCCGSLECYKYGNFYFLFFLNGFLVHEIVPEKGRMDKALHELSIILLMEWLSIMGYASRRNVSFFLCLFYAIGMDPYSQMDPTPKMDPVDPPTTKTDLL